MTDIRAYMADNLKLLDIGKPETITTTKHLTIPKKTSFIFTLVDRTAHLPALSSIQHLRCRKGGLRYADEIVERRFRYVTEIIIFGPIVEALQHKLLSTPSLDRYPITDSTTVYPLNDDNMSWRYRLFTPPIWIIAIALARGYDEIPPIWTH